MPCRDLILTQNAPFFYHWGAISPNSGPFCHYFKRLCATLETIPHFSAVFRAWWKPPWAGFRTATCPETAKKSPRFPHPIHSPPQKSAPASGRFDPLPKSKFAKMTVSKQFASPPSTMLLAIQNAKGLRHCKRKPFALWGPSCRPLRIRHRVKQCRAASTPFHEIESRHLLGLIQSQKREQGGGDVLEGSALLDGGLVADV